MALLHNGHLHCLLFVHCCSALFSAFVVVVAKILCTTFHRSFVSHHLGRVPLYFGIRIHSQRSLKQFVDVVRNSDGRDVVSGRCVLDCGEDKNSRPLVVGQLGFIAHGVSWLGAWRVHYDFLSDV